MQQNGLYAITIMTCYMAIAVQALHDTFERWLVTTATSGTLWLLCTSVCAPVTMTVQQLHIMACVTVVGEHGNKCTGHDG